MTSLNTNNQTHSLLSGHNTHKKKLSWTFNIMAHSVLSASWIRNDLIKHKMSRFVFILKQTKWSPDRYHVDSVLIRSYLLDFLMIWQLPFLAAQTLHKIKNAWYLCWSASKGHEPVISLIISGGELVLFTVSQNSHWCKEEAHKRQQSKDVKGSSGRADHVTED